MTSFTYHVKWTCNFNESHSNNFVLTEVSWVNLSFFGNAIFIWQIWANPSAVFFYLLFTSFSIKQENISVLNKTKCIETFPLYVTIKDNNFHLKVLFIWKVYFSLLLLSFIAMRMVWNCHLKLIYVYNKGSEQKNTQSEIRKLWQNKILYLLVLKQN